MARLFIAVWPPDHVAETLMSVPRENGRGVRFVPREKWHVTLRFLGEADPRQVIEALDAATLVPAHAQLGPAVEVMAKQALVVPVHGVEALAAGVTRHTKEIGQRPRDRFVGHLTLARLKSPREMPQAFGSAVTAEFDVDEIALVQSRLDPRGARYETIHAWPVPRKA